MGLGLSHNIKFRNLKNDIYGRDRKYYKPGELTVCGHGDYNCK